MSVRLTTDAELAEQWHLTLDRFHDLRKKHKWPHVRLGRFDFRFTDEQIAQIVASRSVEPGRALRGQASGLTERSARRSA